MFLSDKIKENILLSWENGSSVNKIAKENNVSWNVVKEILALNNKYNIKKANQYQEKTDYNLFDKIDTEEKAYWLGFLYADGNIRKNRNEISLDLKDLDAIEAFHSFCGNKNKIRTHILKRDEKNFY